MTVTIHIPPGVAPKTVLRRLVGLAGGDRGAVRSGHTGLVVSDALALAYLADGQPAASDDQISRHRVPPNLARVVRTAEHSGGLLQPAAPAAADEPAAIDKTTRAPATRRPRRRTEQGAST